MEVAQSPKLLPRVSKGVRPPPFVLGPMISTVNSLMRHLSKLTGAAFRDAELPSPPTPIVRDSTAV